MAMLTKISSRVSADEPPEEVLALMDRSREEEVEGSVLEVLLNGAAHHGRNDGDADEAKCCHRDGQWIRTVDEDLVATDTHRCVLDGAARGCHPQAA
jgi:hypothetical protein